MKAFISYSAHGQYQYAQKAKEFLEAIEIKSFLADDDLRTASDWKNTIVKEINISEIFIPLLSKEFKASDWCSQELGIAYSQAKKIIPISLDGTKPYGFINHLQTRSYQDYGIQLLISEGLLENHIMNGGLGFAKLVKEAGCFQVSEKVFKILYPFFDVLDKETINQIIEFAIGNGQVWSANECAEKYIPELLKKRKNDIDPKLYRKLEYQIRERRSYYDNV